MNIIEAIAQAITLTKNPKEAERLNLQLAIAKLEDLRAKHKQEVIDLHERIRSAVFPSEKAALEEERCHILADHALQLHEARKAIIDAMPTLSRSRQKLAENLRSQIMDELGSKPDTSAP